MGTLATLLQARAQDAVLQGPHGTTEANTDKVLVGDEESMGLGKMRTWALRFALGQSHRAVEVACTGHALIHGQVVPLVFPFRFLEQGDASVAMVDHGTSINMCILQKRDSTACRKACI